MIFFSETRVLKKFMEWKTTFWFNFACEDDIFCFLVAFSKKNDSDGNFPKKLPYSSFWKFYFSVYQTVKWKLFQIFWFRTKTFTTLWTLYQTFTTCQTFNFVFFSKETEFRSQWCFVLFYPGETDYRCILFAFLKRTIVTKLFFRKETLN